MASCLELNPNRELAITLGMGIVAPPPIHVSSPRFDGSLAMLFACVRDHKVDLRDVPLAPICEAYFQYLLSLPKSELDEAAAALSALAYLLERKAWMLIPRPEQSEPEYEEPSELPPSSIGDFATSMEILAMWQSERGDWYFRSPEAGPATYELPYELANVSAVDLSRCFQRVLDRARPQEMPIHKQPRRHLADEMEIVRARVSVSWSRLEEVFGEDATRTDCVYWFLALLELVKQGDVLIRAFEEEVHFMRPAEPRAVLIREAA
jgi:segregation and condensation protein A